MEPILQGFICPNCGCEISVEEADGNEAPLCARCPDGEYTPMEPVYEMPEEDDE